MEKNAKIYLAGLCGMETTISGLAETLSDGGGYKGEPVFETSKPDGAPRKLLDVSRPIGPGWSPELSLHKGIEPAHADYQTGIVRK